MKGKEKAKQLAKLGLVTVMVATIGVVVVNIERVQDWLSQAGGVKADIVVDTQAILGELPRPWANLAQGGEESEPMLDDVVGMVKALKPEYVRIDHIYDFYDVVDRDEAGKLRFDWSKLDRVVNSILAMGAKPFLALSYMPPALATGDVTSKPKDYSEWSVLVSRTISHFSGKANRNIADVYYEVWNEPDLFGGYRIGSYLPLYEAAASGATAAKNTQPFKFGGPATTGAYRNWMVGLLESARDKNTRLDFISWHRYNLDPGVFWQDAENVKAWMSEFPGRQLGIELIVSEWGHDSENNAGYDGTFSAAHTMAVAIEMMNRVDKGFVFEIKDGPDPTGKKYWGRWGVITHESQAITAKPRYQALKMLAQLSDARLSLTGKGTWVKGVAAKDGEATQVLLVNYDRRGKHSEVVPVTFENLKYRDFEIQESYLSGKSLTTKVATTAAVLKHEVLMQPLSAVMLKLIPELP